MMIEGMIIGSYAIGAHTSYIYIRGEYVREARDFRKGSRRSYDAGYLGIMWRFGYKLKCQCIAEPVPTFAEKKLVSSIVLKGNVVSPD